ncbi:MAG: S8 family peptidase [Defluviitaleaceae bacterium]|nr:S8 family peptidase [Defluviitaleaceae bacterium]
MESIQLIVECKDELSEELLVGIGTIKYRLPIIGAYVLELPIDSIKHLKGIKNIKAVYETSNITTQSLTGKGINIAILDTGLWPAADFTQPNNRLIAFKDFVNGKEEFYDDNGHGTHVAGIACGNGYLSEGKHKGVAMGAGVIAIKVLDDEGKGNSADVLAGLQWVADNKVKYGIRIVNLSVGTPETGGFDPLTQAVEHLWDMGVVVVVAAGNNGPGISSVTSPGSSRKVITVGACDDNNESIGAKGENLLNFSGRGPTKNCIIKPDILAPGTSVISVGSKGMSQRGFELHKKRFVEENYLSLSGTSMSTPKVSGAIAILLEKHPGLSPDDVKYALKQSASDLSKDANHQGWGRLNIQALIEREVKNVREKSI